jgi:hypothetical protein
MINRSALLVRHEPAFVGWLKGTGVAEEAIWRRMLTAVENGGAGRSKMVALGGVDLP